MKSLVVVVIVFGGGVGVGVGNILFRSSLITGVCNRNTNGGHGISIGLFVC